MTKKTKSLIPVERVESLILLLRGQKIVIDSDLAALYGVATRALNQAIKRNIDRFPPDFMFQLSKEEKAEVVTNCDDLQGLKFSPRLPYAFTEQGVAMLSSVLRSKRAVAVNIAIMRTFVKLRQILTTNDLLRRKIESVERKYDEHFQQIFDVLESMLTEKARPRKQIGYHTEAKGHKGKTRGRKSSKKKTKKK